MPKKGKLAVAREGGGKRNYNERGGAARSEAGHLLRNLREKQEAKSTTSPPREGEQDDFQVLFSGQPRQVAIWKKTGSIPGGTEPAVEMRNEDSGLQRGKNLILQ